MTERNSFKKLKFLKISFFSDTKEMKSTLDDSFE